MMRLIMEAVMVIGVIIVMVLLVKVGAKEGPAKSTLPDDDADDRDKDQ